MAVRGKEPWAPGRQSASRLGKNDGTAYILLLAMAIPAVAVPLRGTPVHLDASEKAMDIRFQCLGPDQWKAEILIVPVCQGENMLESCPALDNLAPWLAIAPAMRDFQGKKGQQALLHGHPELRVPRVLAIGPGIHPAAGTPAGHPARRP